MPQVSFINILVGVTALSCLIDDYNNTLKRLNSLQQCCFRQLERQQIGIMIIFVETGDGLDVGGENVNIYQGEHERGLQGAVYG